MKPVVPDPWQTGGLPFLNVAATCPATRALGPGVRAVVWVQGCPFRCPGCIAPEWIPLRFARLIGPEELAEELLAHHDVTGLTFSGGEPMLPAAQTRDRTVVSPEAMERICAELRILFDFIIIDSPAGIERGFANAIAGADEVVIITTPHISSIRDADRVIGLLEAAEKQQIFLVINRLQVELVRRGDMLDIPDILDILVIDLLGIIPEDEFIVVTSNRSELASLAGSFAGQAYKNIARRLLGEDVPVLPVEEDKGFVKRLARLFKGQ